MSLHPFIEAMIASLADRPGLADGSPTDARALIAAKSAALGSGPEMHEVRQIDIPTRGGSLPARLLMPTAAPRGLAVYLHGGGWVMGTIDDFDTLGRALAKESGCAILMPDYRLAPEHPFPAAIHDCEDVLLWADRSKEKLADGGALVIVGDSAGGNLATVVASSLRDKVDLALQILICPVTDCDFNTGSYKANGSGKLLTAKDMEWFFRYYAPETTWPHPEISPLRATNLTGLPPMLVVTAEYDVLADEGRAYAEKLSAAGVPVEHREVAGMTHGFIRLHNLLDVARHEVAKVAARIASACSAPPGR